jgi:3-isopropylmalate/(R)-2-methylmalate dehydratase large subunit
MVQPLTLFEKLWNAHIVAQEPDAPAVLYIDLHLIHEVTSPQAFNGLRERGLRVRRPDRTVAVMDHSTPTKGLSLDLADELAARQLRQLVANCREFDIPLYDLDDPERGIVHVVGPELGLTQPGLTIVCGDSHTATHGAFGALAFGIGTSEVEHVLASQCLLQNKPKTYEIRIEGSLGPGVTAKDIILALIAHMGTDGGSGYVFEYRGRGIQALSMDERMTICNMSIEAGARAGMVAPDDTTYEYLAGRKFAPRDGAWETALAAWRELPTDEGAHYDHSLSFDASELEPMITYGTNPGMGMKITQKVPDPDRVPVLVDRLALEKALGYMDLRPGEPLLGHPLDVVFIGSCTNARLSDLRASAEILKGRKIAENLKMYVVPGSQTVKRQAEAEKLDEIFKSAGAEWRQAGCSMCIAMNGDQLEPGQYALSTTNRNFEGRQGKGGRTFLASPLTAAASALQGSIADVRTILPKTAVPLS